MLIYILDKLWSVLTHFEEISFFRCFLNRTSAIRTASIHKLGLRPEGFTWSTVKSIIRSLIYITLFIKLLEYLLHTPAVILISSADETVIGCIHHIEDPLDLRCLHIDKLFRTHAGCLGLFLYLLSVFIRSGLEIDIVAQHSLISGDRIRHDDLVGVADMRLAAGISDRCGNVIFAFIFHDFTSENKKGDHKGAIARYHLNFSLSVLNANSRHCLPVDSDVQDPSSSDLPAALHQTAALCKFLRMICPSKQFYSNI